MTNDSFKKITSLQNHYVKHMVKLKNDRSYREETGTAIVTGSKMVNELSKLLRIKTLFILESVTSFPRCEETFFVTEEVLKKMTALPAPESMVAEFYYKPASSLENFRFILALDGVSDPGNLGTLLRSALALGWEGVFLLEGCADLYNDKTIRASRGSSLHFPHQSGNFETLLKLCEKNELTLYIADSGGIDVSQCKPAHKKVLMLGNEGQGVREDIKTQGTIISVPISSNMESLNVAIAGSILMYVLK